MPFISTATLLVILSACLIALLLVLLARRESDAVRSQARADVQEMRDHLRRDQAENERWNEQLTVKETEIQDLYGELDAQRARLEKKNQEVDELQKDVAARQERLASREVRILSELSGLSAEQAEHLLFDRLQVSLETKIRQQEREASARAERKAKQAAQRVLLTAMQRALGETSTQAAITLIKLPAEDLKGRIIGKEGRNIQAFQALTGVDLIIEDGAENIILSSYDAARREIAEVAMRQLLSDGRIQPERIEQAVRSAQETVAERHLENAHEAMTRAGVSDIPEELLSLIGGLRFRNSAGQNVLEHLVESARIAAMIAAEVGADVEISRKAAFLHDIGKGLDPDVNPSHALAGAALLDQLGEVNAVVHAVAAHHDEVKPASLEAVIVQLADAASAARPGARINDVSDYVERLGAIETKIAELPQVREAIVMSSGREIRVVVDPAKVQDHQLELLAQTVLRTVEDLPSVLGNVSVTVIRETRAQLGSLDH